MPDKDLARIAVIGCGNFAQSRLHPSIRRAGNIHLVAVCDLDDQKAMDVAKGFGADAWYTDMDKMMDAEKPDGVCVIGPGPMQHELGKHVLERGFPLYTEKPCANTSAEAEELAHIAQGQGLITACAFMKRHSAAYLTARAAIERDEFGPVSMIEVRFTQGPYPALWGIEEPMRAFLIGQLVHIFDLTRFLAGDVTSVAARLYEREPGGTEGVYAVTLTLANGGLGIMNLNALESDTFHFNEYARVTGYQHWIDVEDMQHVRYHPLEGWLGDSETRALKNQLNIWTPALLLEYETVEIAGYVGEIRDFAECCLTGRQPVATAQDCAEALKIGEAIWASAQSGGGEVEVGSV